MPIYRIDLGQTRIQQSILNYNRMNYTVQQIRLKYSILEYSNFEERKQIEVKSYLKVLHISNSSFGFCMRAHSLLFTTLLVLLSKQAAVLCRLPPPQLVEQGPQPPAIQTNRLEGIRSSFWIENSVEYDIFMPRRSSVFETIT